ncbi:hypothetical protein [Streptomyces sporangiiformans]|uniref:Uncharacterized protein n=1 Tax=Streptomyces sporangiiformans TaxID=2315329 RepID=A0A505D288_9ACTN|nr:hypothetical protein [Streptomyces sporangiiformans]TPQ15775.1 hypothetical protein FGD71_045310 [Streptomyces sporangiiformans]
MGTKTVDEAGVDTGTEAKRDKEDVELTKDADTADDQADVEARDESEQTGPDFDEGAGTDTGGSGVGQGAAAVVSAGLGIVSLTGSWVGTVAQARDSLYGQLEVAQNSGVGTQLKQLYGDSWNAQAAVAGFFALAALIVGVVVLVRPAFGNPDRLQAPWVKSVAWAGVSLGVIGLLLAALKYTDILLSLPSAPTG